MELSTSEKDMLCASALAGLQTDLYTIHASAEHTCFSQLVPPGLCNLAN
jgi:hypothetical protein